LVAPLCECVERGPAGFDNPSKKIGIASSPVDRRVLLAAGRAAGHDPVGEARLYADSIGVVQPVVGIWQGLFLAVGSCY
jgi:hypothetical protein